MRMLKDGENPSPNPKDCRYPNGSIVSVNGLCSVGVDSRTSYVFQSRDVIKFMPADQGGQSCLNTSCIFHDANIAARQYQEYEKRRRNAPWQF